MILKKRNSLTEELWNCSIKDKCKNIIIGASSFQSGERGFFGCLSIGKSHYCVIDKISIR